MIIANEPKCVIVKKKPLVLYGKFLGSRKMNPINNNVLHLNINEVQLNQFSHWLCYIYII